MKALFLMGGFGTRLRPLTFSVPKPLIEFANKPILEHQIESLVKVGVTEVILGVSFMQPELVEQMKSFEKKVVLSIIVS